MNNKLRVIVLAQYFSPDMGGASTRASNVVNGLLRNNCDVTIVAAFPHYPHGKVPERYKRKAIVGERFSTAKVYRVWIPALPHSSSMNRLTLHFCFIISSMFALPFIGDADVVWGANPNLFSFFPSMIYGAFKHVPVIRNVDDLWPEVFYELGYVKSKFARKMLDLIAWLSYVVPVAITPISEGYKSLIISKYGIPKDKVHVIEVGAETIKLKNVVSDSKSTFTIMYSGVLGLGYDFDVVLRCAKLLDKKVNVTFIIRGSGELAPELKKKIKAFGLKNVVLDARFLPVDELSDLLNSADAFVLPMADLDFVDLGLPTKVFEYQSYGKPIICVSSGEVAKYIRITESGLVVNPKDAKGLAEAVVSLYENSEIVNLLGMNGRKFVTEQLSSEKIGERMCTMFSSINYSKNVCEI